MLVRRLLEQVCHDNGATGKWLHDRIEDLGSKLIISTDLFEAMKELKLLGNDAAHIEARDYDKVDEEEAAVSIELAKELLKGLYQHGPLVARLRGLKFKS